MCQDSNRHCIWVWGWEFITLALDKSIWWPDKHMLSNHWGQHILLPQCSTVLCKVQLQASSSLTYVTSDHSLSPPLWNRLLGVDKLLPECPEWTEDNPDVQVAEHSADGLGQSVDVWDGYRCSCWLFLIPLWLGESEPLHKGGRVAFLLQCFLHMFLLGPAYTWRAECLSPVHECSHHCPIASHWVMGLEG